MICWKTVADGSLLSRHRSAKAGSLLLGLPNLTVVPVDLTVLQVAQALLTDLKPRDAIHAAAAILHANGNLITLDTDSASSRAATLHGLRPTQLA